MNISCEHVSPEWEQHDESYNQGYNEGYYCAIDYVAKKIVTDYMGRFPDVHVDKVLKQLRDELIENIK